MDLEEKKILFFKRGRSMGFDEKLENLSFFVFQQNWLIEFSDLVDRNLPT